MNARIIGMAVAGTAVAGLAITKLVRSKKAKAEEAMRLQRINEYVNEIEREADNIKVITFENVTSNDIAEAISIAERMVDVTHRLVESNDETVKQITAVLADTIKYFHKSMNALDGTDIKEFSVSYEILSKSYKNLISDNINVVRSNISDM